MHSDEHTAEIIQFPIINTRVDRDPVEVHARLLALKAESVEEGIDYLIPPMFQAFFCMGYRMPDTRKAHLIVELLRAIMFENFGVPHPLCQFVEEHKDTIDELLQEDDEDLFDDALASF